MQNTFDNWKGNGEALAHYGVLGMKWGMRRYQNEDGSLTAAGKQHYQYQSHATKKYDRKMVKTLAKMARPGVARNKKKTEKYAAKFDKYMQRRERSAELDRREQEGAKHVSTGKAIATRMFLGGDMSKAYHQHLAMMGTSVNKASKGQKTTARIMSYFGGTAYSRLMKAAYIRQDDPGRGKLTRLGNKMIEGHKQSANAIDYVGDKAKKYRR